MFLQVPEILIDVQERGKVKNDQTIQINFTVTPPPPVQLSTKIRCLELSRNIRIYMEISRNQFTVLDYSRLIIEKREIETEELN